MNKAIVVSYKLVPIGADSGVRSEAEASGAGAEGTRGEVIHGHLGTSARVEETIEADKRVKAGTVHGRNKLSHVSVASVDKVAASRYCSNVSPSGTPCDRLVLGGEVGKGRPKGVK